MQVSNKFWHSLGMFAVVWTVFNAAAQDAAVGVWYTIPGGQ